MGEQNILLISKGDSKVGIKSIGYFIKVSSLFCIISLYCSFIFSGKKDISIKSNHLPTTFTNLEIKLSIIFSSNPLLLIAILKSERLILRFLACNVKANSSLSSGMTSAVETMSYPGANE